MQICFGKLTQVRKSPAWCNILGAAKPCLQLNRHCWYHLDAIFTCGIIAYKNIHSIIGT